MGMVKAVEKSVIGTRTAIYDLIQPETGRKIRMFGMVHAGTSSYYNEIQSALDDCDVVFYEGVKGRITRWITLVYRVPTWFASKTGLVGQHESIDLSRKHDTICQEFVSGLDPEVDTSVRQPATPSLWKRLNPKTSDRRGAKPARLSMKARFNVSGVSGQWSQAIWTAMQSAHLTRKLSARRLIHADMSGEKFEAGWAKLDWKLRAMILIGCPILGIGLAFSKSLRKWAFESKRDETHLSQEEGIMADLMQLILHDRDKIMIEKIDAFWDTEPDYEGQAAGVFGAAHLPAIINHLVLNKGFQITGSRWVVAIPSQ